MTTAAAERRPETSTHEPLEAGVVLSVRNLVKTFTLHARGRVIEAVAGISFDARQGTFTSLVGNSGAGKSSILKCIYRTYRADSGLALYRESSGQTTDLLSSPEQHILRLRDAEVGMVTQFLSVLPRQTTVDIVARPLRLLGTERGAARERARELLRSVGLPERLWGVEPATFSGGERQLVNLARALIVRPRLLLLDEPNASLDAEHAERVVDAIDGLRDGGVTMIGVFHNRAFVERLSDAVVTVDGGLESPSDPAN